MSISDTDAASSNVSTQLTVSNGVLNVSLSGGATISSGNNDSSDLTLSGTVDQINLALASIFYTGDTDVAGINADTLIITTSDGGNTGSGGVLEDIDTIQINLSAINDAPVLAAIEGSALAYVENDGAVTITASLTLSDVDDTNLESAEVAISGNYNPAEDLLAFTNTTTITGSWNAATGVLTLSGTDTISAFETALRSVTYENTSDDPDILDRIITFVINDGDIDSNSVSRTVELTTVNDNSVVTLDGVVTYLENSQPSLIAPAATITDVDSADFDGGIMTVALTSNGHSLDRLAFQSVGTGPGEISAGGSTLFYEGTQIGSYSGGTDGSTALTITLNSAANSNSVQALLRSITFEHLSDDPVTIRTFEVTLSDGDGGSTSSTSTITITPINDAPVLASLSGDTVFAINDGTTYRVDTCLLYTSPSPRDRG